MRLRATTSIVWVRALHLPGRLLGRDPCCGSHPIVGRIILASYMSISRRWLSYPLPPSCSIILFMQYNAGLASDWTEVTAVTSVFAGSAQCTCLHQIGYRAGAQPLPISPRGQDGEEVAYLSIMWPMLEEGIVIAPGLSSALARPHHSGHC
jgi:hypothetical protein